jgi:hypothetical protein
LEALPENQPIDSAFLLGPALSPEYDLTEALKRAQLGIYNFYSGKDSALLKLGTSLFGSIDRSRGPAAGAVGFEAPEKWTAESRALYEARLRQIPWRPEMEAFGTDGSHLGWAHRDFARKFLAPIVVQNEARRVVQRQQRPPLDDVDLEAEQHFRPPPPIPGESAAPDSP